MTQLSRLLVGSLFIVSGLIKANDPIGFSYKLNDYFAPGVFNLPWLDPYALEISVFVCVAEIVLGVAILFAARMQFAAWSLLVLMVFFTFLTGYTAIANWFFDNYDVATTHFFEDLIGFKAREDISYMKDCGCFGDAIKLDPWESFLKDVVLLFFTMVIFIRRKSIKPEGFMSDVAMLGVSVLLVAAFSIFMLGWWFPIWFSIFTFLVLLLIRQAMKAPSKDWAMAGAATAISLAFALYCILHLPVKDFRPYKVGNNIAELKECPPDAPQDVYEDTWFYRVNGEVKKFKTEDKPWEIPGSEFVDRETELISKGCEPPIHDFVLEDMDGNDYTEDILSEEYIFLLISYDITKADEGVQADINALVEATNNDGGPYFYGLASNVYDEIDAFRHKHQSMFEYLTGDATMLKTIIRSNPGLVLLNKGTVVAKWHHNDFPTYEEVKQEYLR